MSQVTTHSTSGASVANLAALPRQCAECNEPIPQKRLIATQYKATHCVPCLEKLGDVAKLKRFNEFLPNGDMVSSDFYHNQYLEHQMARVNNIPAPDAAFESAVGDDSFLQRESSSTNNEHAYSMSEAFEDGEEPSIVPNVVHSIQ